MTPNDIKLRMPLSEAFALYAAIDARHADGSRPSYEALELIDSLEALEGLEL